MVCSNPVKVSISKSSAANIPTVINATFSVILLGMFAYMTRNHSRVIKGTPITLTGSTTSAFPVQAPKAAAAPTTPKTSSPP
jgi:hypothetical protein